MGLLTALFRSSIENPSTPLSNLGALYEAFGVEPTDAGIAVTPKSALRSAAFSCGHVLAQSVAQLPWDVYRRDGDNRQPMPNRTEHYLLHAEPNPEMTSYSFRYAMVMRMCFYGAFFAEIERDSAARTRYLWPLINVQSVLTLRDPDTYRLIGYEVHDHSGKRRRLPMQDMIHVPCIPLDGTEGQSILTQARNKIALELAAEKFGSGLFARGIRPSGILETDQMLTPEQKKILADTWSAIYGGVANSNKTPVVDSGLKYKQISITPEDAQFLETRNFQIADIARMFRVPGVLVGITDKTATYASVEQFLLSFAKFTLAPWLQSIEQEFNRKLFANSAALYSKLDLKGLERGDLAARASFYNTMTQVGAYTANRILSLEDENGFDGGDVHLQQGGMVPYGSQQPAMPPSPPAQRALTPDPHEAPDAIRVFAPLFQDTVGAITKTSKRDAKWVRARFEPLLRTLKEFAGGSMTDQAAADYLDGVAVRASSWTAESADSELRTMLTFVGGESS